MRKRHRSTTGLEAGRELLRLHQCYDSVSNYAIDFQTLATDSGWEGRALVDRLPARPGGGCEG